MRLSTERAAAPISLYMRLGPLPVHAFVIRQATVGDLEKGIDKLVRHLERGMFQVVAQLLQSGRCCRRRLGTNRVNG